MQVRERWRGRRSERERERERERKREGERGIFEIVCVRESLSIRHAFM